MVFARAFGHEQVGHRAIFGQQVAVGRGQVQGTRLQNFAIDGQAAG